MNEVGLDVGNEASHASEHCWPAPDCLDREGWIFGMDDRPGRFVGRHEWTSRREHDMDLDSEANKLADLTQGPGRPDRCLDQMQDSHPPLRSFNQASVRSRR